MKDFENIEDWYRNELSNYNVTPNKGGWESLSENLDADTPLTDENVSDWYKKEAAKLEERPDYRVWEKLATKLDTASVWDKLSVSLTRYEQYIWWRNIAIKGAAILLLFAGSYVTYTEFNNNTIISENNDKSSQQETIKTIKELAIAKKSNEQSSTNITTAFKEEKIALAAIQKSNSHIKESNNIAAHNKEISLTKDLKKVKTIAFLSTVNSPQKEINSTLKKGISENDITNGFEQKEFLVKKKKNKIVFNNKRFSRHFAFGVYARRFYLGANFGFKKQGMLTSLKNNPGLGEFKQQSFLNFGKTLGATLGWIFSDKINLETNLNFISTAGYNNSFSNEEKTVEEELKLNYTTLSLLAKSMSNKSTFDNKKYSTNLIGGVYVGYLVSSSSVVNGNSYDNNSFKSADFGIVLGIEQDRYITKSFVITPGIRYQQGLINIANGSGAYQAARNYSFEFNLGIKYILLKKG